MQPLNKLFTYFIAFFLLLASCNKNNTEQIPNVDVNLTLFPSTPQYLKLNAIGGWQYINGGIYGIIVYRKDLNEFLAFERLSTYLPNSKPCNTIVDTNNNVVINDLCSGSKFLLNDGSIIQGPASIALKRYFTQWDGNTLIITNF